MNQFKELLKKQGEVPQKDDFYFENMLSKIKEKTDNEQKHSFFVKRKPLIFSFSGLITVILILFFLFKGNPVIEDTTDQNKIQLSYETANALLEENYALVVLARQNSESAKIELYYRIENYLSYEDTYDIDNYQIDEQSNVIEDNFLNDLKSNNNVDQRALEYTKYLINQA